MRAVRVLREADVVLHDDLISCEILNLIPRTATLISVGKRCGAARVTQEEINALIVAYAGSGRIVVRLKSGDPMLFGRAGEEIDAMRARGIEFEVVPGISTALAAAAALETSLTDRRKAARVIFSTGHRAQGASAEQATHVVYMPGSDMRRLRPGFSKRASRWILLAQSYRLSLARRNRSCELPWGSFPIQDPCLRPRFFWSARCFDRISRLVLRHFRMCLLQNSLGSNSFDSIRVKSRHDIPSM